MNIEEILEWLLGNSELATESGFAILDWERVTETRAHKIKFQLEPNIRIQMARFGFQIP